MIPDESAEGGGPLKIKVSTGSKQNSAFPSDLNALEDVLLSLAKPSGHAVVGPVVTIVCRNLSLFPPHCCLLMIKQSLSYSLPILA